MIYYLTFALLSLFALVDLTSQRLRLLLRVVFVIFSLFMVFFAGLRYNVGIDYVSYERLNQLINSGVYGDFSNTERGYYILNVIFSNYNYMLLFIAVTTISLKLLIIKKIARNNIIFCLFLYFSLFFVRYDMGLVTQGISMAFILLSYFYILNQNKYKFMIAVVAASFFHVSALIFLPLYWLAQKKISLKFMIITIGISFFLAFSLLSSYFFNYIALIIPRYSIYLNPEFSLDLSINMFRRIAFLLAFAMFIKKYYKENINYNIILNIYFYGAVLFYVFKPVAIVSDRGSAFFLMAEIFLWLFLINHFKGKLIKIVLLLFIILPYTLYNFYGTVNMSDSVKNAVWFNKPYIPYQSIFSKD